MKEFHRVGLATRAFVLVASGILAVWSGDQGGLVQWLALFVLAGVISALDYLGDVPMMALIFSEGVGASLILTGSAHANVAGLPYLVIPLFLGGLSAQFRGVAWGFSAELIAALFYLAANGAPSASALQGVLTWIIAGVGLGILGAVFHNRMANPRDDESYRNAIALISQLDAISGKLSVGLDPVELAESMIAEADVHLPVRHAAVFTRTPQGSIAPLRYSTFTAPGVFLGLDRFVEDCLRSDRPLTREDKVGIPVVPRGAREAAPVGVLVVDLAQPADQRTAQRLQDSLSDLALQLQAALLFDNVRRVATSEERNRLAREVHDGVAQDVASLGYLVDALLVSADDPYQLEQLQTLRTEVTRVVAELRASVYDLRNEMRAGQGLGQGVSAFARQIGSRSDLTVHVRLDEVATRLRPEIEAELLRIAQEAMNNARKHSGGQNLWVNCTVRPPYAELEVIDDGNGLGEAREDSHGLRIMRERADSIGARLRVQTLHEPHQGTRLHVQLGKK